MDTSQSRRWGPIDAAAAEGLVSPRTIRRMISRGEIYAERIGGRRIRVDLNTVTGRPLQYVEGEG